mgnify:CR=1 FL=1
MFRVICRSAAFPKIALDSMGWKLHSMGWENVIAKGSQSGLVASSSP